MQMIARFLIGCCLILISCNSAEPIQPHSFSGVTMTMEYRILIGDRWEFPEDVQIVKQIIDSTFAEIDAIYNKWNPDSELSQLNRLKAGERRPISAKLEHFLAHTAEIVALSEGRFDPTIEPLQKRWKEKLALGMTPTQEEIEAILPAVGWNHIHFHEGVFYKDHDATALDLGGIAKGYCIDLLIERLQKAGFSHLFVEWGGEIRAAGRHPSGRPWRIFISRLGDQDPVNAIDQLDLVDQAIATSGDYLQYWEVQEKGAPIRYTHIFDPHGHRPLPVNETSIASVSVAASSCMLADGLATAAMIFPSVTEAESWTNRVRQRHPDSTFWIISRERN